MGHQVRTEPLTIAEIKAKSADNFVEEVIQISLGEIIESSLEGFLDILEDRVIGDAGALSDLEYDIVGNGMYNDLHLRVTGFVTLTEDM